MGFYQSSLGGHFIIRRHCACMPESMFQRTPGGILPEGVVQMAVYTSVGPDGEWQSL
jgi:hypothetical protein